MYCALSVKDWVFIDATIDNTVAIAAQDGKEPAAAYGLAIRQAGWEVARAHPRAAEGFGGWPPDDEHLTLDLPVEAWRFIVDQLRLWDEPPAEGDPESRFLVLARMLDDATA